MSLDQDTSNNQNNSVMSCEILYFLKDSEVMKYFPHAHYIRYDNNYISLAMQIDV